MIFCTRGNSGLKEGRDAKKAWWAHTKSLQTRQQGNCCLVVGRRHAHPPHTSGCQRGSGGLVIRWAHLPTSPHLITQSLSSYSWSLTRCPVGDDLLSSSLAGCGKIGADVTTPPTSLNEGGARVILVRRYFSRGRRTPRLAMTWHCSSTVSCSGDGGGPWRDVVKG